MHPSPPVRTAPRRLALCLAVALLAGCDSDAVQLVEEIDAARRGCTQDSLRAGSEECVQMFQRYAEMGTEAMQAYIGAVQAMGEALDRMPPAGFDTAGLGHAVTPGTLAPSAAAAAAPLPRASRLPASPERTLAPQPRGWDGGGWGAAEPYPRGGNWGDTPYGRTPYPRTGGYDDRPGYEPRHPGAGWGYPERGGWGGGYPAPGFPRGGTWGHDAYGRYEEYGGYDRYDHGRYGGSGEFEGEGYDDLRARGRRYPADPPRGGLLPPEERLQRPWLRERGDARYDTGERWRVLPQRRDPRALPDTLQPGASPRRARP